MSDADAIRKRARQDLVILTEGRREDVRLWEHSLRVTETAQLIARLPEVAARPVDETVLWAAGLYHDAGWIAQFREGEIAREAIFSRHTTPVQRELSAGMVGESLRDLLSPAALETATNCIRMLGDHDVTVLEAQLIAEADNLDEFGALCLWQTARRSANEGRGLVAAIETWDTQKQYGYWTARINDSFRFEAVRRIARERLLVWDGMIEQLRAHHRGDDLRAALGADLCPA